MIREEIKRIIREELTINDNVKVLAERLYNAFTNELKYIKYNKTEEDNVLMGRINVKLPMGEYFNNVNMITTFNIFNFPDLKSYKTSIYKDKCIEGTSSSDGKKINFLTINGYAINGRIKTGKLFDTIYHEVEHIFQQQKVKSYLPTYKSDKYYIKALNGMNIDDDFISKIGRIFYITSTFECDAMVNGIYGECKDRENKYIKYEDIVGTYVYEILLEMDDLNKWVNDNKNDNSMLIALKYYNCPFETLLKRLEYGKKYLINKLGKVISLLRKEALTKKISNNDSNGNFGF